MRKSVRTLNSGISNLDEILSLGQSPNDHIDLGYVTGECAKNSKFVPAAIVQESKMLYKMLPTTYPTSQMPGPTIGSISGPTVGTLFGHFHVKSQPKQKQKK
ncbi:hypothetical protein LIER_29743 [Lithospermum erythrorhizon]|uniref:Uncharacterized protein n=1 Tax=Lithospermum erythrorhizon TaxID=34254 RepID=A0AAV3RLQ5_LITER